MGTLSKHTHAFEWEEGVEFCRACGLSRGEIKLKDSHAALLEAAKLGAKYAHLYAVGLFPHSEPDEHKEAWEAVNKINKAIAQAAED